MMKKAAVNLVMADLIMKEVIPFTYNDKYLLINEFDLIGYKEGANPGLK
ncbi:hypothetical protein [Sutcliffiella horikoshii]